MTWSPAAGEVEDGTGLATAIVPEDPADTIAWLSDRGKTSYSSATDAQQEEYSLEAVDDLQDILTADLGYRGKRLESTQGLLFPATRAYSAEGVHLDSDAVPKPFLRAYRLACEEKAAGTWMPGRNTLMITEHPDAATTARVKYAPGRGSLAMNHPGIFAALRQCLPPLNWAAA